MDINKKIGSIMVKIGISKVKKVAKKKQNLLSNLLENPEDFKLEAFIEGEEFIIKVKKKEENEEA